MQVRITKLEDGRVDILIIPGDRTEGRAKVLLDVERKDVRTRLDEALGVALSE